MGTTALTVPRVLWEPEDLGAKLKVWWNADDTANGAVATWTDRIASLAVTATAGLEPISAATSFNSAYRGLTFDGTDDCLVTTTLTALPTGSTAGEIWAAASDVAASGSRQLVRYGTGAATSRGLHRNTVSTIHRPNVSDGSTNLVETVAVCSGPHIWGGMFAGTTMEGRFDGAAMTPASAVIATLATGTTRLRIGAVNIATASQFWQGVIRHIFITTTLTADERKQLEGWIAWDSGLSSLLPALHPYKATPP
jgi:hypothetical protein